MKVLALLSMLMLTGTAFACDILEPEDCQGDTNPGFCDPAFSDINDLCASSFQGRSTGNTYSIPRPAEMGEWGLTDVDYDGSYIVCTQIRYCKCLNLTDQWRSKVHAFQILPQVGKHTKVLQVMDGAAPVT